MFGLCKKNKDEKNKREREERMKDRPWYFDSIGTHYAQDHTWSGSGHNSVHMIYIIPSHHFIHAFILLIRTSTAHASHDAEPIKLLR